MRWPRNTSIMPGQGIVPPVGNGLRVICTDMWRHIIWTWASFGNALCPGALCGRARRRTAWITSGGHVMCCETLNLPVWRIFFCRGLSSARFGRIRSNPAIWGCLLMSYRSATLISRWRIITELSSEGCSILRFKMTTSRVCGCLCHRQRPWHSVIWSP